MKIAETRQSRLGRACRRLNLMALAALLALPLNAAFAHSNEYLATITGPHGGMMRMEDAYHFEMLVKDGNVKVWVTDHGGVPQSTAGASGSVTIMTGANMASLDLAPAGTNELVSKTRNAAVAADSKILLKISMKGKSALMTRFAYAEQKTAGQNMPNQNMADHSHHH